MKSFWLRDKPRGFVAFLGIAALVIGGLGWVTAEALRLEWEQWQARTEAEHAERQRLRAREVEQEFAALLRLALWRLDSRFAPLLAREEARPYGHYSALFAPPLVLDARGRPAAPASVLEPSPLLSADLPEWMLLHFQVSPEAGWGSPQVLSLAARRRLADSGVGLTNVTAQRQQLLAVLARRSRPQAVLTLVRQEGGQLPEPTSQMALVGAPVLASGQAPTAQGPFQRVVTRRTEQGYDSRAATRSQVSNDSQLGPFNDSVSNVNLNTQNAVVAKPAPPGKSAGGPEQILVRVGPLLPVWLPGEGGQETLIVGRVVRLSGRAPEAWTLAGSLPVPGLAVSLALSDWWERAWKPPHPREVCQGIILDWPRLREQLADEVRDLFPKARVVPMREATPPRPERTMVTLPVELDPGPSPAPEPEPEAPAADAALGWTPLRIGLALSWAAALVALSAVGLGGWSLIDLSQRRIRFVSAVTHELRTPLTTLRLYLEMLTGGMVKDEQQKTEYLCTLHAESERLNRLVGNVLDFSRLENQRPRLELAPLPLAELLERIREAWQTRCQDVGKELLVENSCTEDQVLFTDAQLVQQILGNLIDNACKYSRAAADPRLWLRACVSPSGELAFEVEDRGPGVPTAERRAIFHPFRRGRGAEETAGGVGLGLALALRWGRLLGGRLTVAEGRDHAGACFRLELPQTGASAAP
jgi:signal transduction histidine kinase